MDTPTFGDLLRYHRAVAGLSQEALAERSGLSPLAISNLERGQRRGPRRATVATLAAALRLSDAQTAALDGAAHRHHRPRPATVPHPPGLPRYGTPILGRESDLADLPILLGQRDSQLVTLVGPAGVGKTRLAVEVAVLSVPNFPDGVTWVDLAPIQVASLVAPTVAARLGLPADRGSEIEGLVAYLQGRQTLLVLDNLEQVLPAVPLLQDLLDRCPALRIIVTSRVLLGLRGERYHAVNPLALPPPGLDDPLAIGNYPAVAMFLRRARDVVPDLALTHATAPVVAEVCRRLDGLPLAIELAAALARVVQPATMLERLEAAQPAAPANGGRPGAATLDLLGSGSWDRPDRQQTMRNALAWSYELLSPRDRGAFRRLGVFVGGWASAAARDVLDAPAEAIGATLEALCANQLVRVIESDNRPERFGMLETIRDYAGELLAHSEHELVTTRNWHLDWCVALAEEAEPELRGAEQEQWLRRLEADHDNLRAALGWAQERRAGEEGLRLVGALAQFWLVRGYLAEGRRWCNAALAGGESGSLAARAKALNAAGVLAYRQGDCARALALHGENLALRRELGDKEGIAHSLNNLGLITHDQGDLERAAALHTESLTLKRELGDKRGIAGSLNNLGLLAHAQGDLARAATLHEDSLVLERELGDKRGIAHSLDNLGLVALGQGDLERAAALIGESLTIERTLGDRRGIAGSLDNLGLVAYRQGDHTGSGAQFAESLRLSHDLGARDVLCEALEGLAWVRVATGQAILAARLGAAAQALREVLGVRLPMAMQAGHEPAVHAIRAALGEQVFAAAWAEGQILSIEQAVALALSVHPDPELRTPD
jgi:predicted ATPase/transcriptional regulator with XRE-family HTH domain